jgi:GTP pyrophosphokinase
MFLAMIEDVRVVLIKLADRLHNMRTLDALPEEKRHKIAEETLDIFAPLANRLGMWRLKWELEDLGFRHLDPRKYEEIAALIAERREDRERYIAKIVKILEERLKEEGIEAKVSGRPKHVYSIYRKMERKELPFEQIYDVRGVRIIVNTVKDCYTVLGIVHSLWPPILEEFDDFIAIPKDNMYRSLHTTVITDDGKTLEVQIRTHEMHQMAEYGIAAHWRYKEGAKKDMAFEAKIAWLRSLMEWRKDVTDAKEFLDSLKSDVFLDRVYTFTPKGDVIDLPVGSTPIDFAYHIHTEIGHRCRGAKVNGKIVPLNYKLKNGDQVLILTKKREGPSRDWLNPDLGYVKTSKARQKIRQWLKRRERAENITRGREILEKELKRLGLEQESYERIAELLGFQKVDDLLASLGYGDTSIQQIIAKLMEDRAEAEELRPFKAPSPSVSTFGIRVRGVGNLLTHFARCCTPFPGDDIIGYVTRGRGISVHRRDCPNIPYLKERNGGRLIKVEWGKEEPTYPVVIKVRSYDRPGLFRDILAVVSDERINISAASVSTQEEDHTATITATLEIKSLAQLSRVLAKIESIPNVFEARRER